MFHIFFTHQLLCQHKGIVYILTVYSVVLLVIGVAQGWAKGAEAPTPILAPSTFKDRYTLIKQSVILIEQSFIKESKLERK